MPRRSANAEGVANPKGRLQELLQDRFRRAPEYQTVSTQGPDHARTFVVEVTFDERALGRGVGPSKREAEQAAAAAALAALAADPDGLLLPAAPPLSTDRAVRAGSGWGGRAWQGTMIN